MQSLAEQPPSQEQKSFNVVASVNMMRYDERQFGYILPETRARICDEELSFLVEGIDSASRTSFTLKREGDDLVYFNKGKWEPYMGMLATGVETADHEARRDYRLQFRHDMAVRDYEYGNKMRQLKPGEQLLWDSPYRLDIEEAYGKELVAIIGMKPERRMGFIYRAACNQDGSVTLQSQTVDRSDAEGLAAVREAASHDPDMSLDLAVRVYDSVLTGRYSQPFYAGRSNEELKTNAWETIKAQQDLVEFHLRRLEEIADSQLYGEELARVTTRHIIGVWQAFKDRIDGKGSAFVQTLAGGQPSGDAVYWRLSAEVERSFREVVRSGKLLSTCGGTLKATDNPLDANLDETFKSIFGEDEAPSEEKYSFNIWAYCRECQAPPKEKERKKMCGPCVVCRDCDKKLRLKEAASPVLV